MIVCNRDLRDVALSCWQTGFEKNAWANDWDNIARRFADHQRIIDHWQHALPAGSLMIRYEDLVHDLERYARGLIEFLGLEWHPACLEFHKTRRWSARPAWCRCADPSTQIRSGGGASTNRAFNRCCRPSASRSQTGR